MVKPRPLKGAGQVGIFTPLHFMVKTRASGGIGIHACLRSMCRKA